jgi:hypothetical protein
MDSVDAGSSWRYRRKKKIYIYFFQPKAPDGSILPMMYDVNHEEDKVSMIREKEKARNLWQDDYRFLNNLYFLHSTLI